MPPHQRPSISASSAAPSRSSGVATSSGYGSPPGGISHNDIQAIMSTITQLGQNIQYIQNTQKLYANTLVSLGGRVDTLSGEIKRLKDNSSEGGSNNSLETLSRDLAAINSEISSLRQSLNELSDRFSQISDHFASREDVAEIKYVMNAVNPLEYATIKQVDLLVERKVREALEKSGKSST